MKTLLILICDFGFHDNLKVLSRDGQSDWSKANFLKSKEEVRQDSSDGARTDEETFVAASQRE